MGYTPFVDNSQFQPYQSPVQSETRHEVCMYWCVWCRKLKQMQQAQTIVTNTILCTICGGTGHIAQDCKQKRPGDTFRNMQNQTAADRAKMDSEVGILPYNV